MTEKTTLAKVVAAKPEVKAILAEKAAKSKTATPPKTAIAAKPAVPKKVPVRTDKQVKISDIKPKKIKMVSESFTLPKDEYALLATFKDKCLKVGVRVKKSELLRASLICLSKLSDDELIATVAQVEQIKPAKA